MPNFSEDTQFALEVAQETGEYLLKAFNSHNLSDLRGSVKGAVTEYDKESDRIIRKRIKSQFPNDSLLTEEKEISGDNSRRWIVDSIDGTVNFAAKNPLWSVLIALQKGDELVSGITHAPAINETYIAEKDVGAFLNGEPVSVSDNDSLREAYTYVCEGAVEDKSRTTELMKRIYPEVLDLRKIGSAGFEMAWVAAGRADGYVTTQIEPWDVAPGVLLVREAGGEVTTFSGEPWSLETHDIVVSNGNLQNNLLKLVENL